MGQDEWCETRGCSRARKGQGARVKIKARRGGEPLVFAALAAANGKGIQPVGGKVPWHQGGKTRHHEGPPMGLTGGRATLEDQVARLYPIGDDGSRAALA